MTLPLPVCVMENVSVAIRRPLINIPNAPLSTLLPVSLFFSAPPATASNVNVMKPVKTALNFTVESPHPGFPRCAPCSPILPRFQLRTCSKYQSLTSRAGSADDAADAKPKIVQTFGAAVDPVGHRYI